MAQKGISPVVASVLVIAILFSLTLVFSDFTTDVVSSTQDETGNSTERTLSTADYAYDIEEAKYDDIGDSVELSIRNQKEKIDRNLTATAFCENDAFQRQINGLPKRGIKTATVEGVDCEAQRVLVELSDVNVQDEETDLGAAGEETLSWSGEEFQEVVRTASLLVYSPMRLSMKEDKKSETSSFSGSKNNVTTSGSTLRLEEASR